MSKTFSRPTIVNTFITASAGQTRVSDPCSAWAAPPQSDEGAQAGRVHERELGQLQHQVDVTGDEQVDGLRAERALGGEV